MANEGVVQLKKSKKELETELFNFIRQKVFDFQKQHGININSVDVEIIGRYASLGYEPEHVVSTVHVDVEI